LPVTQVALAHLLGVQRTTVAAAISVLQRAGSIRTGRGGGLEVLDHAQLEATACTCRDSLAYVRKDIQGRTAVVCDA
jgi:DNA-binding GntR family transcriptional regulator